MAAAPEPAPVAAPAQRLVTALEYIANADPLTFPDGVNECLASVQGHARTALAAAPEPAPSEVDARRYRWLRKQQWDTASLFVIAGSKSLVRLGTDCPSLDRLDAAIDAAMLCDDKPAQQSTPPAEPVGYVPKQMAESLRDAALEQAVIYRSKGNVFDIPVYSAAPSAQPLTDEEIDRLIASCGIDPWTMTFTREQSWSDFIRSLARALEVRNGRS